MKTRFPKRPNFSQVSGQPRGDESITLTAEDERILDELAAKRRRERLKAFEGEQQPQTEGAAAVNA